MNLINEVEETLKESPEYSIILSIFQKDNTIQKAKNLDNAAGVRLLINQFFNVILLMDPEKTRGARRWLVSRSPDEEWLGVFRGTIIKELSNDSLAMTEFSL